MVTAIEKAHWLKVHSVRENHLFRELREYFVDQAKRVALALLSFDQLSPEIVPQIFRIYDEHELLLETVERPLLISMVFGAENMMAQIDNNKLFGFIGDLWDWLFRPTDLPPEVLQRIRLALSESTSQPYWQSIQSETSKNLEKLIANGIRRGDDSEEIAQRLTLTFGGLAATSRALRIARTETTAALNAGNEIAAESMLSQGLNVRKEWITITDKSTRATHNAANGQTVAVIEQFDLGGFMTPYPAHWSLPAKERINCRCSVQHKLVELE